MIEENHLSDRDLLRKLMFVYDWNQAKTAEEFGVTPSFISQIMNGKKTMKPALRRLAELLIEKLEREEQEAEQ
jgi:transcriptional regulator with XRE-family HTH domain